MHLIMYMIVLIFLLYTSKAICRDFCASTPTINGCSRCQTGYKTPDCCKCEAGFHLDPVQKICKSELCLCKLVQIVYSRNKIVGTRSCRRNHNIYIGLDLY